MKLVKQLFAIKKYDWLVVVKDNVDQYDQMFATKSAAVDWVKGLARSGDKVQIYKLSYELKDAYVVGEKKKAGKK